MRIIRDQQKVALTFRDQSFSYHDLLMNAAGYGNMFAGASARRVMIFAENRPEWIFAFFGCWLQGAVAIPVDVMSTASELSYMIDDSKPDIIICTPATKKVTEKALQHVQHRPAMMLPDIATQPASESPESIAVEDTGRTAVIIYTSGTTGSPKGVMLTFENLLANIRAVSESIPIFTARETTLILLPLHHIFPLVGSLIAPLYSGGSTAMSASLDTADILGTLQRHRVSIIIGVPRLYALIRKGVMDKINASRAGRLMFALAAKISSRGFSKNIFKAVHKKFGGHIRYMVCGGAPLEPEVARDYRTLGFEMLEGYGMTEAAPMISFTRPGHWKIGAAGQIMPGVKVEIRDGEIVASGKNIMQGYLNKPEDTAEILKDGWLYTGDLGDVDRQGFIRITGRKKEILVTSGGKNINPANLEQALFENIPAIKEVAVLLHNEKLHALINPDRAALSGMQVSDPAAWFREKLLHDFNPTVAPYKQVLAFTLIENELPRTRLGKIQRFKLHEFLAAPDRAAKEKTAPDFREYSILKSYLEQQKSVEVSPGDHLEFDLGLDSLDKVGLQSWLEKSFGVELKVENLRNFPSVIKLAEYIREKKSRLQLEKTNWSEILKEKVQIRYPGSWWISQMVLKFSKYLYKVYFRLTYSGLQNIPKEPCIIAPNHQSFFDAFIIASLLKRRTFSKTYFYAKEKHIKQRWLKYLAGRNNIIIVDLNNDLRLSIQKMAMALQNNRNIIIFPEGTRTKTGEVGQFKETFAILSRELGVPVVPVAIKGAWHAFPPGSRFPKPFKQIEVDFLSPVYPGNESYRAISEEVRNSIRRRIA